jgi:hypothetical protein
MNSEFDLPCAFPHDHPVQVPEDLDSNWTPVEKALETYTQIILQVTWLWILSEEDKTLDELWQAPLTERKSCLRAHWNRLYPRS